MPGIMSILALKHGIYDEKIQIHSSCEIEDFVDTHLCEL